MVRLRRGGSKLWLLLTPMAPADDLYGPVIIVGLIFVAVLVNFILRVNQRFVVGFQARSLASERPTDALLNLHPHVDDHCTSRSLYPNSRPLKNNPPSLFLPTSPNSPTSTCRHAFQGNASSPPHTQEPLAHVG